MFPWSFLFLSRCGGDDDDDGICCVFWWLSELICNLFCDSCPRHDFGSTNPVLHKSWLIWLSCSDLVECVWVCMGEKSNLFDFQKPRWKYKRLVTPIWIEVFCMNPAALSLHGTPHGGPGGSRGWGRLGGCDTVPVLCYTVKAFSGNRFSWV